MIKVLPEKVSKTLYIYYDTSKWTDEKDRIKITDYDSSEWTDEYFRKEILLASIPFEIDLSEFDITPEQILQKTVARLEKKKSDIHAEYHLKLSAVQEEIDNLLAIEYKPDVTKEDNVIEFPL